MPFLHRFLPLLSLHPKGPGIILPVFLCFILMACSQQQLKRVAGATYLGESVTLERQRHFTINAGHSLALVVEGDDTLRQHNEHYTEHLSSLGKGLEQAVSRDFAVQLRAGSIKSTAARSADFIIQMKLLAMSSREFIRLANTHNDDSDSPVDEVVADKVAAELEDGEKTVKAMIHRFSAKILLLDARSRKVLDIAHLQARSGQVYQRADYQLFSRKAFERYTKSLAPKNRYL